MYNSDLGVGKAQQCDAATGLGCDYTSFSFDYSTPPVPELGPSNIPRFPQVWDLEPDSEVKANEGPNEDLEGSNGDVVYFLPDIELETEDDIDGIGIGGPRVLQGEEVRKLDIERKLEELGSSVLTRVERDNIKAMALKIGNQLMQKAYKGIQKLTQGCMEISSEYIAGRILERMLKLSFQIYDCCVNSCTCFTGEFEPLTTCLLCRESRRDKQNKA